MFDFQKHVLLLYHLMLDDISKKKKKSKLFKIKIKIKIKKFFILMVVIRN